MNKSRLFTCVLGIFAGTVFQVSAASQPQNDPLSLWTENNNKKNIVSFINKVETSNIPVPERIATFDFDGTLGVEKPTYSEVFVSASKMCELAKQNPSLKDQQPYKASCNKNWTLINNSARYTYGIILTAFLDQPVSDYYQFAENFLTTSKHPKFEQPFSQLVYAPMVQLIELLLSKDFTVYIVSGSQTFFLRAMVQEAGLPIHTSQIIGSTVAYNFAQQANGTVEFLRQNKYLLPMSDGAGKAELITGEIGRTPLFAAGNTMGDYQMLLSTTNNSLLNEANGETAIGFGLIINHDDPVREYQYTDAELMKNAKAQGWSIISMKNDFKVVFDK